jgi:DNA-binding PadR family transcriptional regulator
MHGYELGETHGDYFGPSRQIPYGQIYASLKRLERDEYAKVVSVSRSSGPDRTHYEITDAGSTVLHEWLGTFDALLPVDDIERKVITLLLAFADESGAILDGYIASLTSYLTDDVATPVNGLAVVRKKIDTTLRRALADWMLEVRETRPVP